MPQKRVGEGGVPLEELDAPGEGRSLEILYRRSTPRPSESMTEATAKGKRGPGGGAPNNVTVNQSNGMGRVALKNVLRNR